MLLSYKFSMYGWQRKVSSVSVPISILMAYLKNSSGVLSKCAFGLLSKLAPAYLISPP